MLEMNSPNCCDRICLLSICFVDTVLFNQEVPIRGGGGAATFQKGEKENAHSRTVSKKALLSKEFSYPQTPTTES